MARKATALLAYLVVAARSVPREVVADFLWPFQPTTQSRHSLRNCLLVVALTAHRQGPASLDSFSANGRAACWRDRLVGAAAKRSGRSDSPATAMSP